MTDIPKDEEEAITIDDVIAFLNKWLELDRAAMCDLLANRVPCNESLANHPIVWATSQHDGYHVGMFDVLNGLFGQGKIRFVFDDGGLVHFGRVPPDSIPR